MINITPLNRDTSAIPLLCLTQEKVTTQQLYPNHSEFVDCEISLPSMQRTAVLVVAALPLAEVRQQLVLVSNASPHISSP